MGMHANRGDVYGIGVNDANYVTQPRHGERCPYYEKWHSMLRRCYSQVQQARKWGTERIEVCRDWHSFMAFRHWMRQQGWFGLCLDKDWLGSGTLYSPNTCAFVPHGVNSALLEPVVGDHPLGVSEKFDDGRLHVFISQIYISGRKVHLGVYQTAESAHNAWKTAKIANLEKLLSKYPALDKRVCERVDLLRTKLIETGNSGHTVRSLHRLLLTNT